MADETVALRDFPPRHGADISYAMKSAGTAHEIIALSNGCVMTTDDSSQTIFELSPEQAAGFIEAMAGGTDENLRDAHGARTFLQDWYQDQVTPPASLPPAPRGSRCIK